MLTARLSNECELHVAMEESASVAETLLKMAQQAEQLQSNEAVHIMRYWAAAAGTYTYHTHARVYGVDEALFTRVVDCFFHAASLKTQPWYAQFLCGQSLPLISSASGCTRAALCLPEFDFGLGKTHSYRQLLSEFSLAEHCRALVLRSVIHEQAFPANTVPAFTLSPTGDLFHWHQGVLHWHHICTVAGVGIMPPGIERHVMNALRWLRLDLAERKTYREEAEAFIRWMRNPPAVVATWESQF